MQRKSLVPIVLFAGLTIIGAVATAWFGLETWLLSSTADQPITWYVRNIDSNHPATTLWVVFVIGLTSGSALVHFVADRND